MWGAQASTNEMSLGLNGLWCGPRHTGATPTASPSPPPRQQDVVMKPQGAQDLVICLGAIEIRQQQLFQPPRRVARDQASVASRVEPEGHPGGLGRAAHEVALVARPACGSLDAVAEKAVRAIAVSKESLGLRVRAAVVDQVERRHKERFERQRRHGQRRHLGVVEVIEHLPHVAQERASDFRQPRAVPWFPEEKVRTQLVFDVADMPRDDGLIDVQPQPCTAEIRLFRCDDEVAQAAEAHASGPRHQISGIRRQRIWRA